MCCMFVKFKYPTINFELLPFTFISMNYAHFVYAEAEIYNSGGEMAYHMFKRLNHLLISVSSMSSY